MRTLRYILISCLLTLGIFFTITYTACKGDKCKDSTCLNGNCNNGDCTCFPGWGGERCEIDLCKDKVCENGGMCVDGICKCVPGYEGERCELVNKFVGEYNAYDSCNTSGTKPMYLLSMVMTAENVLKITPFAGEDETIVYGAISTSGNTLTLYGTNHFNYPIEGSAVYDEATGDINVGYVIHTPGGVDVACSGTWVKHQD